LDYTQFRRVCKVCGDLRIAYWCRVSSAAVNGALPILTPLAALSLCMIMVLAIADHVKNKEINEIGKNVIIILLAAFVTVGRFGSV